jgi:hypothetical protein
MMKKSISFLAVLVMSASLLLMAGDKPAADPNKECTYCHCCTLLKNCNKMCKEGVNKSCVNWPGCKSPGCGKK